MRMRTNLFGNLYVKLLGYYPNQFMNEEVDYPDVVKTLKSKIEKNFGNLNKNNTYIFTSNYDFLIGYYNGIVRVTNVQWNDKFGKSLSSEWVKV